LYGLLQAVVKADSQSNRKWQISCGSKAPERILTNTLAFTFMTGTDWYKCGRWLLCLECVDKILSLSAVLKQWLLQQRETEASFVLYNLYSAL